MAKTITAKKDVTIYIANTSADKAANIALCPDNTPFTLAPEQFISIKVDSAREYLYYLAQNVKEDISVSENAPASGEALIAAEKDKTLVITNGKDADQAITLYPDNTPYIFGAGDVLNIEVKTAREYIYYCITAQTAGLTVTEAIEEGNGD